MYVSKFVSCVFNISFLLVIAVELLGARDYLPLLHLLRF